MKTLFHRGRFSGASLLVLLLAGCAAESVERESFGVIIAAASYRSEYLRAQGELKLLAEAARNKNCTANTVGSKSDARPRP
jgi:hypothetical protein